MVKLDKMIVERDIEYKEVRIVYKSNTSKVPKEIMLDAISHQCKALSWKGEKIPGKPGMYQTTIKWDKYMDKIFPYNLDSFLNFYKEKMKTQDEIVSVEVNNGFVKDEWTFTQHSNLTFSQDTNPEIFKITLTMTCSFHSQIYSQLVIKNKILKLTTLKYKRLFIVNN